MVRVPWKTKKLGIPLFRRLIADMPFAAKMGNSRRSASQLGHSNGPTGLPITTSLVFAIVHLFTCFRHCAPFHLLFAIVHRLLVLPLRIASLVFAILHCFTCLCYHAICQCINFIDIDPVLCHNLYSTSN